MTNILLCRLFKNEKFPADFCIGICTENDSHGRKKMPEQAFFKLFRKKIRLKKAFFFGMAFA